MSLYSIAQNIEASALGQAIRESTWLFPAIEATHLLALAMLGGSVLIIALAVLGIGLKVAPLALHQSSRRYTNAAVITLLITGILLGISEPVKLYGRQAFWVKMTSLIIALLITYFAFNPLVNRGADDGITRTVAALTMAAWLTVAMAGRWIGFSRNRKVYSRHTTNFAEWVRQLIGITKDREYGVVTFSKSCAMIVGTEMTKLLPKSRRALPDMVFATSPTRSLMFSSLVSVSCMRINNTVNMPRGAVK